MDGSGKRPRAEDDGEPGDSTPRSLNHPVSPPLKKSRLLEQSGSSALEPAAADSGRRIIKSPFQLTKIRELSADLNVDTVTLKDILGDPLISECWEFNYLHDIDLLMAALDEDVRHLVQVHVIHGFWKTEDPNRLELKVRLEVLLPSLVCHRMSTERPLRRLRRRDTRMFRSTRRFCQRCLALITQR